MSDQSGSIRTTGRRPKYRTSCDNCQAAKIKCGHEKPDCRRCSAQRLKCVYSLSRRMGRPRAKNAPEDTAGKKTLDNSNEKRAPQLGIASGAELPAEVDSASVLDVEASGASAQETDLGRDPWSPVVGDFEGTYEGTFLENSSLQPADGSMNYLLEEAPMDLDEASRHSNMAAFLENTPGPDNFRRPRSSASEAVFQTQDLISPQLLNEDLESPLDAACASLQQPSVHSCAQFPCMLSERSAAFESMSGSSVSGPLTQMLECEFQSAADSGYASQVAGGSEGSSVLPHAFETKATGSANDPIDYAEESKLSKEVQSLLFPSVFHSSYSSAILKQLSSLEAEQQKIKTLQIDRALMLEAEVQKSLSHTHQFKNSSQTNHVYLLELVSVKMMLDLLQKAVHTDFVSRPRHNHGSSVDGTFLYIGNFKVTPRARSIFLRKILQARLYRLADLVKERERVMSVVKQDGFAMAGSVLMSDISRALRTFMGLIEVWGSRYS
ncbi:Zn(2)-C6 fungal-type DNA-binding domain protein [Metarhizium rileyi]|uniref:Zn(2)-C6 fungal-type DNA-binding domain protein n=1 Tax=Metarhizium rileyi (strain RCEF 4871) TaxID=1649241 RepID=A0A162JFE8_METRR|nr:Zn(2)-C6 fungal-type DNA-binding domain protein [Metarhizium rileyi RCEF 4871]